MYLFQLMVEQSNSTLSLIFIKDCSFKEEKTIQLRDFVFSEAGMDSHQQQWIDGKVING